MRPGTLRDPDWPKIKALIHDGQRRWFLETGERLSARRISERLRHRDGTPYGSNIVGGMVNPKMEDKDRDTPTEETLYALATFFGDDPTIWLEAGGRRLAPDGQSALTDAQRKALRMLAPLPEDRQVVAVASMEGTIRALQQG